MKARIKATGEIAEFSTGKNLQGETILLKVGTASIFSLNEVEPIHDIDWQHYRIQASIAAMQAYISDGERMALVSKKFDYDDKRITKFIAEGAVMYADALVAELKKGGVQDENG